MYKIRTAEGKAKIDGEKLRSVSNDWDLNLAMSELQLSDFSVI